MRGSFKQACANKVLMIFLIGFVFIFMIGVGSAVECGVVPTDGCTISQATTFNTNTYLFNGSANGAIQINGGSNYTVDCNNSIFIGNWSVSGNNAFIGIHIFNRANVTLKNCTLYDYNYGIKVTSSNGTISNSNFTNNRMGIYLATNGFYADSNITNNHFENNSYAGIWYNTASGSGTIIKNNIFNEARAIRQETAMVTNNLIIQNNTFNIKSTSSPITTIADLSSYWRIINNSFNGFTGSGSVGLDVRANNSIIEGNFINRSQIGINLVNVGNVTVLNNIIRENDEGMQIFNAREISIINNTLSNNTINYDSYDLGIKVKHSTNITINGNNFTEVATTGVLVQNSTNLTINSNSFSLISMNSRSSYSATDYGDPACAISIVELYKSYWGNGEDSDAKANIANITLYKSSGVNVYNNIFDSNTRCYLRTEGTSALNHNLSSYWYRRFWTPINLKDQMEFYISSSYNNLSSYYSSSIENNLLATYNLAAITTKKRMQFKVFNNYLMFNNTNDTTIYQTNVYNQTYPIYYNCSITSGSVLTNSQSNLSLNPGASCYVS